MTFDTSSINRLLLPAVYLACNEPRLISRNVAHALLGRETEVWHTLNHSKSERNPIASGECGRNSLDLPQSNSLLCYLPWTPHFSKLEVGVTHPYFYTRQDEPVKKLSMPITNYAP